MTKTSSKNLLKVEEVSKVLALHPQTIYTMCADNKIPHLKIGQSQRSIRFDAEDINKWLDERKHQVSKPVVLEPILASSVREYDKLFLKRRIPMAGKKGSGHWNYGYGGIYERKTKAGLIRYDIWFYDEHHKIRQEVVKMAVCKKEALVALEYKRREIFKKLYFDEADKEKITFKDYAEKYLKEIKLRALKSRASIELNIRRRFIPFFGNMELSSISTGKVKDYILMRKGVNARGKGTVISNNSLNIELAHLKRIFSVAIEEEEFSVEKNPVKPTLFLKDDRKKRDKVLNSEEEERLLKAASPHLRPIIITALNTGMRKMEIASLQWKNVSLKNRVLVVTAENSKNSKPREIPINTTLLKELKVLKASNGCSKFVFVYEKKKGVVQPVGDFKISWMKAIERSGISNFTFHGLRHTFASRLAEMNVHPFQAQRILGHSSVNMTEWYSHSSREQLLAAVEKVNGDGKSSGLFKESVGNN